MESVARRFVGVGRPATDWLKENPLLGAPVALVLAYVVGQLIQAIGKSLKSFSTEGMVMEAFLMALTNSSPVLITIAVITYIAWAFAEKRLTDLAAQQGKLFDNALEIRNEIGRTSLDIKSKLREEERGDLVEFRVALERWQDFLLTGIGGLAMAAPIDPKTIPTLYEKDNGLFLDVKVALVKATMYLRSQELEEQLMQAVLQIRQTYYPLIGEAMSRIVSVQGDLAVLSARLAAAQQRGEQLTQRDREEALGLQTQITEELGRFAEAFIERYPSIAEQLDDVKAAINFYIYRPIESTDIDRD